MFRLISNFYRLGFNYRPLITPQIYKGGVVITNPNTAPEISGAFLASTPTCGMGESLIEIRDWLNQSGGKLVRFSLFDTAPRIADRFRITAEIADLTGSIKIATWWFNGSVWVRQPYTINHAIPISISDPINYPLLSVVNNKIVGGVVGQSIPVVFGFEIIPVENFIGYNRSEIEEIPFVTVPLRGFNYVNP